MPTPASNTPLALSDRIDTVLARDETLLDVLVGASPSFEKLRNRALRQTMARLVTVEQAARIAGLDPLALVARLNEALSIAEPSIPNPNTAPSTVPAALLSVPSERVVDCDVREDLRAGREPFARIFAAAQATPAGGILRVRAIFEPAPLYAVLAREGFSHFTERLAADDWRVWFHRGTPASEASDSSDGDVVILDVRGLEPADATTLTFEALATLPRQKTLVQLIDRVPSGLLPELEARGFTHSVREQSPGLVRIFVRHARP